MLLHPRTRALQCTTEQQQAPRGKLATPCLPPRKAASLTWPRDVLDPNLPRCVDQLPHLLLLADPGPPLDQVKELGPKGDGHR